MRGSRWVRFPSVELSGAQAMNLPVLTACHATEKGVLAMDLPVLTACHPTEKGVLACTTYIVIGLWLSAPGLQDS